MIIYIRSESYPNEFRTPLVPRDIKILNDAGYIILVEKSETRCFSDEEYRSTGATLISGKWYIQDATTIILGLKKLDTIEKLNKHVHVYFSHTLKNQVESREILEAFKKSGSTIFDLEYLTDQCGKRLVAFGFYAGLVGAVLGLRQYYNRIHGLEDISNLKPWDSYDSMLNFYKPVDCKVLLIGDGRCSKGVQSILNQFNIRFDLVKKDQEVNPSGYNILINCITLDTSYKKVWIRNFNEDLLIVDISCDYSKVNNPLPIYKEATTWEKPVYNHKNFSVIALDNLPSLLPCESSSEFSKQLTPLLLKYGDDTWKKALNVFENKILEL